MYKSGFWHWRLKSYRSRISNVPGICEAITQLAITPQDEWCPNAAEESIIVAITAERTWKGPGHETPVHQVSTKQSNVVVKVKTPVSVSDPIQRI